MRKTIILTVFVTNRTFFTNAFTFLHHCLVLLQFPHNLSYHPPSSAGRIPWAEFPDNSVTNWGNPIDCKHCDVDGTIGPPPSVPPSPVTLGSAGVAAVFVFCRRRLLCQQLAPWQRGWRIYSFIVPQSPCSANKTSTRGDVPFREHGTPTFTVWLRYRWWRVRWVGAAAWGGGDSANTVELLAKRGVGLMKWGGTDCQTCGNLAAHAVFNPIPTKTQAFKD